MHYFFAVFLFPLFVAGTAGALLFLSFPPHNIGWLAWIGLMPLLIVNTGKRPVVGFLLGYTCGLVFFLGVFNWILHAAGYAFIHHILLDLYLGFYFGLFGAIYAFISKRLGALPALLTTPFVWVFLEFVRSNLSFLSLPWGLLAHSQYRYLPVIQTASIGGVYLTTFWVVSVNSSLTIFLLYILGKLKIYWALRLIQPVNSRFWLTSAAGATMMICLLVVYGIQAGSSPVIGQSIKVSVIQGNIAQNEKFEPGHAEMIMKTYSELTARAASLKPDLIVWPETATPGAINLDRKLLRKVQFLADSAGTALLIGSSQVQKFRKLDSDVRATTNSAFMILPGGEGNLKHKYDKIRLFPFGEYLPYPNIIPWAVISVPDVDYFYPGHDLTLFNVSDMSFAVTICWENMFADFVRKFVKRGAKWIINITNEAWFGNTAAAYQFLSMNVFRAVENRVYVVRCANTGISCIIDPYGRVVDRVRDHNGNDVFVRGTLTGTIVPLTSNTIYTRYGNWFVWFSVIVSLIVILYSFTNPRNLSGSKRRF